MKQCLLSGSFDPITKGHEELIERAKTLFDKVYVCIFENPEKRTAFSFETRLGFISELYGNDEKVQISSFSGLLVDFMKQNQINANVRGIRNASDFEYEVAMENVNKKLLESFQCIYFSPSPDLACVSSSVVRQLLKFGGDISFAIDEKIAEKVKNEYEKNNK